MKQLICFVLTLVLLLGLCAMPTSAAESVVYVSANGSDSNAGTETAPLLTLSKAYTKNPDKIILLDNTTYSMPSTHTKTVTISGKTADVQLSFADGSSFAGPTVLDNLIITSPSTQVALHCQGNPFTVTETVTCSGTRIALFAGMASGTYTGDTHLNIYGGSYNYIYGGSRNSASVFNGNAYVTIGGNTNITDLYANDASNSLKCEVYGAGQGTFNGNTYLTVTAGAYNAIYGGSKSSATFTGNTYVTVGGSVNAGEGIDDAASNISRLSIYGGGTGPVAGNTNVTLDGDAVCKFIYGAGSGTSGTVSNSTNVHIKGGKVMNAFGGSPSAALTCNLNLTMTGGVAEALFGGSSSTNVTGNTHITVLGGEVYRRIYSGCYNDWTLTYKSSYYVTGNTYLVLGKDASIINKNALSSDNQDNMGIFSGSRLGAQKNEINTLIYLDGASAKHKSNVGDVSGWSWAFKNCADYTVTATGEGLIKGSDTQNNTIDFSPADGYASFVANNPQTTYTLSASSTTVDFKKTFKVENVTATENGIEVSFWAENALNAQSPRLLCAIYEADGTLADVQQFIPETTSTSHTFAYAENLQENTSYNVKVLMWTDDSTPQTEEETLTFIK